jgi:cell fate (sporulation/competence/biofilm development) regulator YlbF (YheA/YmcA/DUF963 family)
VERELGRANANLSQVSKVKIGITEYLRTKEAVKEWITKYDNNILKNSWAFDEFKMNDKLRALIGQIDEKEQIKKLKDLQKRLESLRSDIEKVQTNTSISDNDILECCKKIQKEEQYFDKYWCVAYYKEAMTEVYKIERTILKPKRLSIFDDMSGLESALKKDVMDVEAKLSNYKGGQHGETSKRFLELYKEIEKKKETLAVKGKSAYERADDFSKLNYLLQYLKEDYDPETCPFPEPNQRPGYCTNPRAETNMKVDTEKRIRIARVKALAKLKMLQLLNV